MTAAARERRRDMRGLWVWILAPLCGDEFFARLLPGIYEGV